MSEVAASTQLPTVTEALPARRRLGSWLTGAELGALPTHVQRELDTQRQRNEILAGWIQASLVLVFAVFYSLSRKTFSDDTILRPVPWALGIYAAFTAWRLYLAYRGKLGHPMLMLSVIVDVAVLMVTIWSFHIQYGQAPAFYLKSPTLLYVFIFIALRALSLMPVYVLFAGVTAAVGWLTLVAIAIMAPGGHDLITRDYVTYMTSLHILIGGEVDKIISILMVSVLLAVAASRARSLLYRAVAEQAAAQQLARFFSPEIAATIVGSDEILQPGQGRQTEAAAMFVDMRGFTRLATALPPRELIALLGEYQRIAVPVIQKNGGSITTYLGDGIMVTFGATRITQTYAADALRTAEQLLDALTTWAQTREAAGLPAPGVGIGIHVGTVTCGAIGDEGRLEYAVIGDPVNRAAKLQNHTKAEKVRALTTPPAVQAAVKQGYDPRRASQVRQACKVAGIEEPLDVVVIE
ncbi:MAG: adenylate/guanylate cyclase domain-containing protein [Betaproteobacteria bacterium]